MLDDAALELIRLALREDLSAAGDVTTNALVPADRRGHAVLLVNQDAILAGSGVFEAVFAELDPDIKIAWHAREGDVLKRGTDVAHLEGSLRAILTAERTALNFIQRLSGVATLTHEFVQRASGVHVRDTRKTTPGMRRLEKAAVRAGGGTNHRMGLYDAFLVKDNHVAVAGSVAEAIARARAARPDLNVQVECDSLEQVCEAIDARADEILLDNMDVATLREAVALCKGKISTEASGGVTLEAVAEIAATGVDAISVGALTHSAPAVDFSLEVTTDAARG